MLYRTIRVPEWVYYDAVLARSDTLNRGLQSIPEQLREPVVCPRCRGVIEIVAEGYLECGSCGFKQEKIATSGNDLAGVGLGVILGLGLAAYFNSRKPAVSSSPEAVAGRAAVRRIRRSAAETSAARITDDEIRAEVDAARKHRPRRRRSA
jgi:hypothetical protein